MTLYMSLILEQYSLYTSEMGPVLNRYYGDIFRDIWLHLGKSMDFHGYPGANSHIGPKFYPNNNIIIVGFI